MTTSFEPPFAVVGLGLVGGSVARGLRAAFPRGEILGIETDPFTREAALRTGIVTKAAATCGESSTLTRCSLIVVCAPLPAMPEIFTELGRLEVRGLVTDVAGVKGVVEAWAAEQMPDVPFIGGHPMAGGERGGFGRARQDLFERAPVALCPAPGVAPELIEALAATWKRLGARPALMTAADHDALAARSSHLPYLTAVALLGQLDGDASERLLGRGFSDATRHAAFEPEVMATVAVNNPALPDALRSMAQALQDMAEACERDPDRLLHLAREARDLRRRLID